MAKEPEFEFLHQHYRFAEGGSQDSLEVVKLSDAVDHADEAGRLLSYLHSFGFDPVDLNALYQSITELDAEEELSAFRCREGIAVAHASDGWWILFIND